MMGKNEKAFYLKEWEIWYTYTTSLRPGKINLKSLADRLVKSELAHLSMLKDGYTVWNSRDGMLRGNTSVDLNDKSVLIDENGEKRIPDDFAGEAWYQCAHFRFSEHRLFNAHPSLPPNYVRAFIGKCILYKEDENYSVNLYPILTVYETGVMSIEFRKISPLREIHLDKFIIQEVNRAQIPFDRAGGPPALSKLASSAYMRTLVNWNMRERAKLLKLEKNHAETIDERTVLDDDKDFTFELSELSLGGKNQKEWLYSLALTIFDTVAYLLCEPKEKKDFIFWGQPVTVEFDGYWVGRPHVYLCDFSDQKETASLNEEMHKSSLTKILMKSVDFPEVVKKEFLPEDARLFEDCSAYLGQTLSLWVWSKKGIKQQETWDDGNRGHLIYEKQATMRFHDYVYILYRRLLNESITLENYDEVISLRREMVELEQKISEVSAFGEIRDLLKNGWSQMGLDGIKNRINKALSIKQEEKSNKETRAYRKIGITLTIIFGLASIPTLANEVLKPLWMWGQLPKPTDSLNFQILLIGIVFIPISIAIGMLVRMIKRE
jgi:hypothetical protein